MGLGTARDISLRTDSNAHRLIIYASFILSESKELALADCLLFISAYDIMAGDVVWNDLQCTFGHARIAYSCNFAGGIRKKLGPLHFGINLWGPVSVSEPD
jgi:hypothetical protein